MLAYIQSVYLPSAFVWMVNDPRHSRSMPILPRPEPRRGNRRKRKAPAPPPLRKYNLDVSPILDEVPAPLGLTLWQRWRDVYLWSTQTPGERQGLFYEDGSELSLPLYTLDPSGEKALARVLRTFAAVTVHPDGIDTEAVAAACVTVAEWAYGAGFQTTEELFAELAPRVRPADPDLALFAGRLARRKAEYRRAVEWFRRALGLARQANDLSGQAVALLSWGILEEQRDNVPRARELFTKALSAASRVKSRKLIAAARHNLLVLYDSNTFEEGQKHAEAALSRYSRSDERLPALVHDIATLWLWHGFYGVALPILQRAAPLFVRHGEQIQITSNLARAAGALGLADLFLQYWDEVERLVRVRDENAAAALVNVARGARSLRFENQARELATRALEIAARRREGSPELAAQALLSSKLTELESSRPATPELEEMAKRLHRILDERVARQ